MIGRFLLGAGLGSLVGTGLLALVSVALPAKTGPQGTVAAEAADPAKPAGAEDQPGTEAPAAAATPEPQPEPAPSTEAAAAPSAPAEAPAAPVAPDASALPLAPAADEPAAGQVAADLSTPATPAAEPAPAAPETPAKAPEVASDAPADASLAEPAPPSPAPTPGDEPAPVAADDPAQLAAPSAEPTPDVAALTEPPPLTPEEEALLAEIAEKGPEALPDPADLPAADAAPEATPEASPVAPAEDPAPGVLPPPSGGTIEDDPDRRVVVGEGGSTLPSTPSLNEAEPEGVTKDRLPSIAPAEGQEAPQDDRPLALYARAFDNPDAKPTFAILLIDTGAADVDRAALASLPFPVTFALDPLDPETAARAQAYREAGQEVVMLATGLPNGAAASDVEQAFQIMGQALPEAVAVMDLPERSFQADRPLASLVVPVIGGQGRGLVTWDEGLNAADQVARREDVPAAVIFRDLDAGDEEAAVIRRYLDRAAFKAAQEGSVTVVGRTRPETITALLEWTVEGRAATVALAPVTAVLSID